VNLVAIPFKTKKYNTLKIIFNIFKYIRKRFGNYFAYNKVVIHIFGGERGIRTLDTTFQPYNGLANRRLQPLGHLS
jgi:hypothetical protein